MQNFRIYNCCNSTLYSMGFSWIVKRTNNFHHLKHNYFKYRSVCCLTDPKFSTEIVRPNKMSKLLDRNTGKLNFTVLKFFSSNEISTDDISNDKHQTLLSSIPLNLETFNYDNELKCDKIHVYPWSISGIESCTVIESDSYKIAFDIGYATKASINCRHVFISHGHMDHIAGLYHHASKRSLYGLPQATYYVPPNLVDLLKSLGPLYSNITGHGKTDFENLNIVPVIPGEKIEINANTYVVPFSTIHCEQSQGYLVYKTQKKRKITKSMINEDYGVKMEEEEQSLLPMIVYTGDTTFEFFQNPPHPDILKCRLLITEATYLNNVKKLLPKAKKWGHIHLQEILDNFHLFDNVQYLYLLHISDRHSIEFIQNIKPQISPDITSNCKLLFAAQAKYAYKKW